MKFSEQNTGCTSIFRRSLPTEVFYTSSSSFAVFQKTISCYIHRILESLPMKHVYFMELSPYLRFYNQNVVCVSFSLTFTHQNKVIVRRSPILHFAQRKNCTCLSSMEFSFFFLTFADQTIILISHIYQWFGCVLDRNRTHQRIVGSVVENRRLDWSHTGTVAVIRGTVLRIAGIIHNAKGGTVYCCRGDKLCRTDSILLNVRASDSHCLYMSSCLFSDNDNFKILKFGVDQS